MSLSAYLFNPEILNFDLENHHMMNTREFCGGGGVWVIKFGLACEQEFLSQISGVRDFFPDI